MKSCLFAFLSHTPARRAALAVLAAGLLQPQPGRASDLPPLRPLALNEGETLLRIAGLPASGPLSDAAPDGVLHVFRTWRGNGNAWGYSLVLVTTNAADGHHDIVAFDPLPGADNGGLRDHLTDAPHTGEDAILSLAFASSADPARPGLFLVECQRMIDGPVPDPAPARLLYYRLEISDGSPGWTPLYFGLVKQVALQGRYGSADDALREAFRSSH